MDRKRLLSKVDQFDQYLRELSQVCPADFAAYQRVEIRRSVDRLLQVAIKALIDAAQMIVKGERLGLPCDEQDAFVRLADRGILSQELVVLAKSMRGFRNLLGHEYGRIDDRIVFDVARTRMGDLRRLRDGLLTVLR